MEELEVKIDEILENDLGWSNIVLKEQILHLIKEREEGVVKKIKQGFFKYHGSNSPCKKDPCLKCAHNVGREYAISAIREEGE